MKNSNSSLRYTAIDLFCGCGGLTLGLKEAGFDVISAVEVNHSVVQTYSSNHPEITVWQQDIRELSASSVMRRLGLNVGSLDLLAGCPPCQGFSALRTMNGGQQVLDSRNDLLFEFLRFIRVMRPKSVMMENVPGLSIDGRFEDFGRKMSKLGYEGAFAVLDAARYGVPQRRRRLIYLAGRGFKIPFAEPNSTTATVRDAIGNLPRAGTSGDPIHDFCENRTAKVRQLISLVPKDGGSRASLPDEYKLECHKRCSGFKDVYGRMAWDDVAPTLTSGCFNPSKGRFLHPEENRAITMREAALLQGFPGSYRFAATAGKAEIALMVGNALPPPFISAHAKEIRARLDSEEISR